MNKQFALALLFALLLEPASATSGVIEATLPVASMESFSFYPDPEGILSGICDFCGLYSVYCTHTHVPSLHRISTFTAETFLTHPEWPCDSLPSFKPIPEQEPIDPELLDASHPNSQALRSSLIQHLNQNATSILPSTVKIHVEDTYLPGDRLEAQAERRRQNKRQAPRRRGFPCTVDGCGKTFDRSCDLTRHCKTHLDRSERPHKCKVCNEGFLYPKDRNRHERTHDELASPQVTLYCGMPGCSNVDGFSRRDNLLRHQRKQHPRMIATA